MSLSEITRLRVIEQVKAKQITQAEGAKQLGICKRQMIRLCQSFEEQGPKGLISKRLGKPSNNRLPDETIEQAIALLKDCYVDVGPTLAHEKLTEVHQLTLSVESVRKLMIKAGLWPGNGGKPIQYHSMR